MEKQESVRPEQLVDAMAQLFMHFRDHFERGVAKLDLPVPCAKALRIIDGSISMKELSARIYCDASFVTAIADMLEERGFARREIDPADRRVKRLVLTAEGLAMRERIADEMFSDVPGIRTLDADERERLFRLVETMVRREQPGGCPVDVAAGEVSA
jgi:DNA-binding MarR family transcriptional regulator